MKRKIADWMYKFWYNNHTHFWIVFTPKQDKEKCMMCNQLRKKVEELTFKSE